MEHLIDCPICQKIVAGEIESEVGDCCLVVLGSLRVAAKKTHSVAATPDLVVNALDLLQHHVFGGLVSDYSGAPGHWAMRLKKLTDPLPGKSEGKAL